MGRPGVYDYKKAWSILKVLHSKGMLDYGHGKDTIDNHIKLPSKGMVCKKFGNISKIREKIDEGLAYDEATIENDRPSNICLDCVEDNETCGKQPSVCEKEAVLWKRLGDKNTVAEYLGAADFQLVNR